MLLLSEGKESPVLNFNLEIKKAYLIRLPLGFLGFLANFHPSMNNEF